MKDVTVIFLVLFQKILKDKESLFPITALHGFCVAVSAVLIYLIAQSYWNPDVGFILSIIFLGSFWPWQISLFVGHVHTATMFFLAAVCSLIYLTFGYYSIVTAGVLTGLLLFSSSSSFKYILPVGAALLFGRYGDLIVAGPQKLSPLAFEQTWPWSPIVFFIILIFPLIFVKFSYKKIIYLIYSKKGLTILKKFIPLKGSTSVSPEHYIAKADKKLEVIQKVVLTLWLLLSIMGYLFGPTYLTAFLSGIILVFLILTLPNIPKSLGFYLEYVWYHANQKTGLVTGFVYFRNFFKNYFTSKGMPIPETMRGGLKWLPRLFWRIAPIHSILWLGSLVFVVLYFKNSPEEWIKIGLITVTSLLPIIWGEITKSPQLSRTYFPGFVCLFVLIGYFLFIISSWKVYWPLAGLIIVTALLYNFFKFFSDVYPSRMTITNIDKALKRLGIKEFYTLKTGYQYALAEAMEPSLSKQYNIKYFNNLEEISQQNVWMLIPGMSSKTAMPEIDEIKNNQDLTNNLKLNQLIESREIEKMATAKFKTFGTSNIYTQEGEVPSYRDLILHEITEQDRFYGYAWLIHSNCIISNQPFLLSSTTHLAKAMGVKESYDRVKRGWLGKILD